MYLCVPVFKIRTNKYEKQNNTNNSRSMPAYACSGGRGGVTALITTPRATAPRGCMCPRRQDSSIRIRMLCSPVCKNKQFSIDSMFVKKKFDQ